MRALHTRHRHHNDVYARRVWFLLAVDDYIVWAPFKTNQPACFVRCRTSVLRCGCVKRVTTVSEGFHDRSE